MAMLSIKSKRLKKPSRSKTNILTLYSPKSFYIEKADTKTIVAEVVLDLPEKATACLIPKFQGQKIETIIGPKIQRLWVTLPNEFYFDRHQIKHKDIIGYLIFEPTNLKIYYETEKKLPTAKTRKLPDNYFPKDWEKNWKKYWKKKKSKSADS